jgi:SAM-dependent methyltransferase
MEMWRYYDVTHARHGLMNPFHPERILELGDVLRLDVSTRVLDIACGHAEMLMLWHERFGITGVGIDASPYHFARAVERKAARLPDADLQLVEGDGKEFASDERFDVAVCLGASWIWDGHAGTLRALTGFAKPGGVVVVGEPHWRSEPTPEYLAAEEVTRETFHDLAGCRDVALEQGLELMWMADASPSDWDRYEMLQCAALDEFARKNPDDPDLPALIERRRRADEAYLTCGRDCLGWAVWAFRTPA